MQDVKARKKRLENMSISLFLFKFCEDSGPSSVIFREELAKNSVTIERTHLGLLDFVRTCNFKRRLDERGGLTLSERKSTEAIVQFILSPFDSLHLTIIEAD